MAKASIQLEFPGNHLFKEIAGHARAETNIVGLFWYDPKRLPSRRATDRPMPSWLLFSLVTNHPRNVPFRCKQATLIQAAIDSVGEQ